MSLMHCTEQRSGKLTDLQNQYCDTCAILLGDYGQCIKRTKDINNIAESTKRASNQHPGN